MSHKISLVAACIFALSLGQTSYATSKDVVLSSSSKVVRDSNGGCVRTKWDSDTDKCDVMMMKGKVKNMIMTMDERIIYFDFDKHNLKDSEKAKLDVLAAALEKNNVKKVNIIGFTDRIGTDSYNHKLSHKRADAVKAYLDSKVQLDKSVVTVKGLGEAHQVKLCEKGSKGEVIKCLAPNRRVEVESDFTSK